MATIAGLGTPVFNTTSGTKTVTATPAVGDLIVLVCAHSGYTGTVAPTDNNADGLGTYSLINSALKATSADKLAIYVRDKPIGSATSTVFSHAPGTTTGGGVAVFKLTGISKQSTFAALKSAKVENQASGTPTVAMGSAINTGNPVLGVVFNATNPATMTARASPAYTEVSDIGYNTPASGLETMVIASGETGSSIAWGSSSASAYCAIVVEFDTSTSPFNVVQSSNIALTAAISASGNLGWTWNMVQSGTVTLNGTFAASGNFQYAVPIVRFDLARSFLIALTAAVGIVGDVQSSTVITSYNTSFTSTQDPYSDSGNLVSRDPNSSQFKSLASPNRAVSKQTGTPVYISPFNAGNFFNDAQAFINPAIWTAIQYTVQITVGPTSGLSSANKEVELLLAAKDNNTAFTAYYGPTTTTGVEINWQHQGQYAIAGWYKENGEIGRLASPPTPNTAGGDVIKAELTYDGSNRLNIRLWINNVLQTWDVSAGDGITAGSGTILIDTRHPGVTGVPGFGAYRDVDGEEALWYITNFQAAAI